MNIKVGKYILRSDQYCMWVEEEYQQKNGQKASKKVAGYASNLNNLLRQFSEKKLYGSDAETVGQLISDLREIMSDMVKLNGAAVEQGLAIMSRNGEGND